jgi:hypothetical protein
MYWAVGAGLQIIFIASIFKSQTAEIARIRNAGCRFRDSKIFIGETLVQSWDLEIYNLHCGFVQSPLLAI